MNQDQLDRIEEKLDKLIKLLEPPQYPAVNIDTTGNYPVAPHEQKYDIYYYPWQRPETSLSP